MTGAGLSAAGGATFYLEPVTTLDVDIFVAFRSEPGQLILSVRPIYEYLTARGCSIEGEYSTRVRLTACSKFSGRVVVGCRAGSFCTIL